MHFEHIIGGEGARVLEPGEFVLCKVGDEFGFFSGNGGGKKVLSVAGWAISVEEVQTVVVAEDFHIATRVVLSATTALD